MSRIVYVNGRYVHHAAAAVHVEDRGYQFADGVYEVLAVLGGRLRHRGQHFDRLDRSLAAVSIAAPVSRAVLARLVEEVVRRNRLRDGVAYVQVTRGVAHRNHPFPAGVAPALVISAWPHGGPSAEVVEAGVAVVTRPDQRWKRPDIKSVGLLPNVLARQSAKEAGAYEAWLVNDAGAVTEGTATNAFIVDSGGTLLTHPADGAILGGVTRCNVLALARDNGVAVAERPFTPAEAAGAAEAFVTGTTITVLPVTTFDGRPVADGRPGPLTRRLRALYAEFRDKH